MAQGDPMKWHMPGWRIEQRFAPGVLIGNWGEERYTVSFSRKLSRSACARTLIIWHIKTVTRM